MPRSNQGNALSRMTAKRDNYKALAAANYADVLKFRADAALLDWADAEGHYDAGYESLRAELRDRGKKLAAAKDTQPTATAATRRRRHDRTTSNR